MIIVSGGKKYAIKNVSLFGLLQMAEDDDASEVYVPPSNIPEVTEYVFTTFQDLYSEDLNTKINDIPVPLVD
jgi:hypothetical protein